MKLFRQNHKGIRSESQGVPEGTFRCDVCKFIMPAGAFCGTVVDAKGDKPEVYSICGCCALWLGLGTSRFPQGILYNFSEKQRAKIDALQQEFDSMGSFDMVKKKLNELTTQNSVKIRISDNPEKSLENMHEFLKDNPNFRSLIKFRSFTLADGLRDLSDRLTRGEPVDPREIKKANK